MAKKKPAYIGELWKCPKCGAGTDVAECVFCGTPFVALKKAA